MEEIMNVYINTQGAKIIREGRHLLVKKGDGVYHTLFTYKLKQLLIFGNIEVTHPAMCQLMKNNIDVVFLSQTGRYLGRLATPESKNVFLHKRQYRLIDDEAFCLRFSKNIVSGKLSNMATLLMRIKRTRNAHEPSEKAREIQNLLKLVESALSVDSVRGYEGRGSAVYFSAFSKGFIEPQEFTKRVRRPPTDPVNAVLSLTYTFLMNRVYAAVRVAGLDPYPGFLHKIDYGRYSLVLDLMEEFRPIIADTLTLSLFNLKILKPSDFIRETPGKPSENDIETTGIPDVTLDPIGNISIQPMETAELFDLPEQRMDESSVSPGQQTGKQPVKLVREAFSRTIDAFEKKMTTSFFHGPAERELTYTEALIFQAAQCRKVIEGEVEVYQPILLK